MYSTSPAIRCMTLGSQGIRRFLCDATMRVTSTAKLTCRDAAYKEATERFATETLVMYYTCECRA
ncbi:unnamed protein product [Fusarium venenatum]|uniref:Uncharacterized protein n=1 Tax=Fusarium venenatum TaxID=56646 RepID=A0A2L2T1J2_9HYPO|nr:uncharacterized protein FVRRES_12584 [Fusarium venenatum]CEI39893.1 unnamed protein product [Fusarium venenatum]